MLVERGACDKPMLLVRRAFYICECLLSRSAPAHKTFDIYILVLQKRISSGPLIFCEIQELEESKKHESAQMDSLCCWDVVIYVCVFFLPIHSGHRVRWTYQPGSHRRKVTQDFLSTFFLRCVP